MELSKDVENGFGCSARQTQLHLIMLKKEKLELVRNSHGNKSDCRIHSSIQDLL